jgi:hypothetical protein
LDAFNQREERNRRVFLPFHEGRLDLKKSGLIALFGHARAGRQKDTRLLLLFGIVSDGKDVWKIIEGTLFVATSS